MDDLQKLLEAAGIQVNERDEDVIQPIVNAILHAYNETYYGNQSQNDIDRLVAIKDIAEAAKNRAGVQLLKNKPEDELSLVPMDGKDDTDMQEPGSLDNDPWGLGK